MNNQIDNLIVGDIIIKRILLILIVIGIILGYYNDIKNFAVYIVDKYSSFLLPVGFILFMLFFLVITYFMKNTDKLPGRIYKNWLRRISEYPQYSNIMESILTAGIIIHLLWILIIGVILIYQYLPQAKIVSFCYSALLWTYPVHLGGIFIAPHWEERRIKKAMNWIGLIGLLLTFFISTVTMEPLQTILQNVRVEWINQIFALLFISSQR